MLFIWPVLAFRRGGFGSLLPILFRFRRTKQLCHSAAPRFYSRWRLAKAGLPGARRGRGVIRTFAIVYYWTDDELSEQGELGRELAVAAATATFQNLAIMGALVERNLIDLARVADWSEFFAVQLEKGSGNGPANLDQGRKVAARLRDYARRLVNIIPPESRE